MNSNAWLPLGGLGVVLQLFSMVRLQLQRFADTERTNPSPLILCSLRAVAKHVEAISIDHLEKSRQLVSGMSGACTDGVSRFSPKSLEGKRSCDQCRQDES